MAERRRAVIAGYYGMANYGDDAFGYVCAWGARHYWSANEVRILAPPFDDLPDDDFAVPPGWLARRFDRSDAVGHAVRSWFKTAPALSSGLIIHGGGSTLARVRRTEAKWLHGQLARRRSTRLAGVGLSLGPFRSAADRRSVERLLRRFSHLALRDRESYELASALDLPRAPVLARDLFGLFPRLFPVNGSVAADDMPVLGVSLAEAGPDHRRRNEMLVEALKTFCRGREMKLELLVLNGHPTVGDAAVSARAAALLEGVVRTEIVDRAIGVPGLWRRIGRCRAFLGVRLHGALSAYLAGVPFALVEYHAKCGAFLDDVGQPAAHRIAAQSDRTADVVAVLERIWASASARPALDAATYGAEAERNFTTFAGFDDA